MRLAQRFYRPILQVLDDASAGRAAVWPPRAGRSRSGMIAPNLGTRVRAQAVGGGDRGQRRPAGGDRPGGVESTSTRRWRRSSRQVPRRGQARLEPGRNGRGGDRSDGDRIDRHVHHPEAARAVEAGEDSGRIDSTHRQGTCDRFPGQKLAFSQPIEMRINEMVSGIRSDLGVKLYGDDFEVLKAEGGRDRSGS